MVGVARAKSMCGGRAKCWPKPTVFSLERFGFADTVKSFMFLHSEETLRSRMSEKKIIDRDIAVALGIICVILLSGLAGAMSYYTSIINNKDSEIQTLTDQKEQLQTWLNGNTTLLGQMQTSLNGNATLLNQTQTWLQANITYYSSVVWALNAQIATLEEQMDMLTRRVAFYRWADGSNATSVDLVYNLYPDATIVDANATYGVKNGATSGREIFIWAESCNATEWISDFKIEILDTNGIFKITVPIVTSIGNTSIIYVGKVGWSQPPSTTFTMKVTIKCKAGVVPSVSTQAQLKLESRIYPHP